MNRRRGVTQRKLDKNKEIKRFLGLERISGSIASIVRKK